MKHAPRSVEEMLMETNAKPLLMVFPLDLASHYLRCIELCGSLAGDYRILFAHSETYAQFVANHGFETFMVEQFDREEVARSAASFDFSWLSKPKMRKIVESQITVIRELNPAMVLGDASFTLKMAAQKTETKFVSLVNGYMTKHYKLDRQVPRAHRGYKYSKVVPSAIFRRISSAMEALSYWKIHEPFNDLRRSIGLDAEETFLDELDGDLNLICDLPELFPQKRLPDRYAFIGPLFHDGKQAESEAIRFAEQRKPAILVTMGSSGNWNRAKFIGAERFGKYNLILSGDASPEPSTGNTFSRHFLNHMSVMPHVDLVICHGGNGTLYQALANGLPSLCIPGNFESEWNSNRISELGLGEVIENTSDLDSVLQDVERWLPQKNSPVLSSWKEKTLDSINMRAGSLMLSDLLRSCLR